MLKSFLGAAYASKNASLISLINTAKDITIFAPNNAAMHTVSGALTSMSEADLANLLSYHIVLGEGGPHYSTGLSNGSTLQTVQGSRLSLSFAANALFVNSARILTADLLIGGGVVHVIDNVLDPDEEDDDGAAARPDPSLATQRPVLETAGGGGGNGTETPFTGFVPDLTVLTAGPMMATATAVGTYVGASGSRTRSVGTGRAATSTSVARGAAGLSPRQEGCGVRLGLAGAGVALLMGNLCI